VTAHINKFVMEFLEDCTIALEKWDLDVRMKILNSSYANTFYSEFWKGIGVWSITEPIIKFIIFTDLCGKYQIRCYS